MSDNLPTVWRAEPHTCAKHAILKGYLEAWFPILSRQAQRVRRGSQEILFVDGFAGPGEYLDGQPGSPVIALTSALEHSVSFPVPVRLLFIEKSEDRCRHLEQVLQRYYADISGSTNVLVDRPLQGECDEVLTTILRRHEQKGTRFGPALAFLDQFGFSAASMELVKRILSYPQCEVFLYLDYKGMNRWISDPTKAASFTRAYGGEEWRLAVKVPESQRRDVLLTEYKKALRSRGGTKYVCSFTMFDRHDSPLYWLVFCTNHLRGLEEMKKAMWKVDTTGGFHFSDSDNPAQLRLLKDTFDQTWLAEELSVKLAGKTLTVGQVKEYVLTETPCCLYKRALSALECSSDPKVEVLNAPPKRRRGTFSEEHFKIRFRDPAP
ncbi:MAG: three-Cys-motif partner protein TcmP [Planctomycetota bacterium]|jgi:three-Cys-motif partner protein